MTLFGLSLITIVIIIIMKREPFSYPSFQDEKLKEAIEDFSSEAKTPMIMLPSTSDTNIYNLTDFPGNKNWGLVERL